MKFRNGATNIGVICGFAVADGEGHFLLHQTSCREMGFRMRVGPEARMPTHEFEPVTVVVRLEPNDNGGEMVALAVSRMARSMVPKSFTWASRDWVINLDFYPFRKDKAGTLADDVMAQLAEAHDFPAWLHEAALEDDQLAALIAAPTSNKHLQARILLTGFVRADGVVAEDRVKSAHDYVRVLVSQPGDTATVGARLYPGTPGYWGIRRLAESNEHVPVTSMLKPYMDIDVERDDESERVVRVQLGMRMLEVNAVAPEDLELAAA